MNEHTGTFASAPYIRRERDGNDREYSLPYISEG